MTAPQLPIYIESYRMTQEIFRCTVKFPREFKFLLGNALNEAAIGLCCQISRATYAPQKEEVLDEILILLEKIRIQLRLCADFKLLSCRQQASLGTMLEKTTSQAFAWARSERRRQPVS